MESGHAVTTVFVQTATPLTRFVRLPRTFLDGSNTHVTFTATVIGLGQRRHVNYQLGLRTMARRHPARPRRNQ